MANDATVVPWGTSSSGTTFPGSITIPATAALIWSGRSKLTSPANGNILATNNAGTDFGLLQLGGVTSAFPAWKRSGATLEARLADDSADTSIVVKYVAVSGGDAYNNLQITSANHEGIRLAGGVVGIFTNPSGGDFTAIFNSTGLVQFSGIAANNFAYANLRATRGVTTLSGATTVIGSNLLPAGAVVVGVASRVQVAITSGTGLSFTLGDGTNAAAFGTLLPFTLGSQTDNKKWTITSIPFYAANTQIVATCTGGTFSGGSLQVYVWYLDCTAPIG